MFDLSSLYQQVIIDHQKSPRNYGELDEVSHEADGYNPLCGDRLHVALLVDANDTIQDLRFTGEGCAISIASASLMTEALKGKTLADVERFFQDFTAMAMSTPDSSVDDKMGKLAVLAGVRAFPSRVKCATLCWHTVKLAIDGADVAAKTE